MGSIVSMKGNEIGNRHRPPFVNILCDNINFFGCNRGFRNSLFYYLEETPFDTNSHLIVPATIWVTANNFKWKICYRFKIYV